MQRFQHYDCEVVVQEIVSMVKFLCDSIYLILACVDKRVDRKKSGDL